MEGLFEKKCKIFLQIICRYKTYAYLCLNIKPITITDMTKQKAFDFVAINGKAPIVAKESEKAVQLTITLWSSNGHSAIVSEQWFPKSVVKEQDGNYFIAAWFANKHWADRSLKFKPNYDWTNVQGLNF